jgi:hypothetical protein
MKEKLLWLAIAIFGLAGLALVFAQAQAPNQPSASRAEIGRYQIIITPAKETESVTAYRLDTATGKAWIRAEDQDNHPVWGRVLESK